MGAVLSKIYVIKSGWIRISPTAEAVAEGYEETSNGCQSENLLRSAIASDLKLTREGPWIAIGSFYWKNRDTESLFPDSANILNTYTIASPWDLIASSSRATAKTTGSANLQCTGRIVDSDCRRHKTALMDMKLLPSFAKLLDGAAIKPMERPDYCDAALQSPGLTNLKSALDFRV